MTKSDMLKKRINSMAKDAVKNHKILLLALVAALGLSLHGASWGKVECWNPDQMAFRPVPSNLLVGDYLKPPLDTYLNRLLVLNPVDIVMNGILKTATPVRMKARLIGCRLVTAFMFCCSVVLLYFSILRCSGRQAASLSALVMATSAGLITFNHYGTADAPLLFWMLGSFASAIVFGISGRLPYALASGLLAGLAAADKYNGVLVAVALPVCALIAQGAMAAFDRKAWLGMLCVPLGFVIGCPGAVFEWGKFSQDFLYNLHVTPVYAGNEFSPGYLKFLGKFPELLGYPCSLLILIGFISLPIIIAKGCLSRKEFMLVIAALTVFSVYFLSIGKFPRIETRFVLPAAPFAVMVAAPAVARIRRGWVIVLATPLIVYNVVCSFLVGERFLHDPRMAACEWAESNLKPGMTIESAYAPSWSLLVTGVRNTPMPEATGRAERFQKMMGGNAAVQRGVEKYEKPPPAGFFSKEGLRERAPDYVSFSSLAIGLSGTKEARAYFSDLLQEKMGYSKVFEAHWRSGSWWAYPRKLDFVPDAMVILKKTS